MYRRGAGNRDDCGGHLMVIKKVGVLGCGLMGSGIAQVSAGAGYSTVVKEIADDFLKKGLSSIEKSLGKFVEKGTITRDQRAETLGRLKGTTKFEDLGDCDIVIEAITENLQLKRETYATIDKIVKPPAIFASNTSSLVVTEMMTATKRVDRFIGMHFFNPVPLMKLVEVVGTITTSKEILDEAMKFAASLGKVPIRTSDRSEVRIGTLPRLAANFIASSRISFDVVIVPTTSTSFISGTGLKKCMPIKRSTRFVAVIISVTTSDDVLLAKIAGGLTILSMVA